MVRLEMGFTLYELMLTLAIGAVLVGLAAGSFSDMAARHRQAVEIDALFHAIHLARKESVMRRKVVSLCPSSDGLSCSPLVDWSSGWIMFENTDRDSPPAIDDGEAVLWRHRVDEQVVLVANRRSFTLRATFLRATNGTIVVCDSAGRVPPKGLVISYTGRPRVAFARPGGEPYSCAD